MESMRDVVENMAQMSMESLKGRVDVSGDGEITVRGGSRY